MPVGVAGAVPVAVRLRDWVPLVVKVAVGVAEGDNAGHLLPALHIPMGSLAAYLECVSMVAY